jgi:hypothetical protein
MDPLPRLPPARAEAPYGCDGFRLEPLASFEIRLGVASVKPATQSWSGCHILRVESPF